MLNYKCVGSEAWSHTPSSVCLQCGWFIDVIWQAGQTHAQMYMHTHTKVRNGSPSLIVDIDCYACEGLALQEADVNTAKIMHCIFLFLP